MDYNFAYLPFVLGLLVVAWFVLAEFLKGESVQEHISKMPKSPPARYPWDDTPWDSDGIDHDHNLKNNYIHDEGDGTYSVIGPVEEFNQEGKTNEKRAKEWKDIYSKRSSEDKEEKSSNDSEGV